MAKLTLSFKDRTLKVFSLDDGEYLIGRDPDCTIVIDSLAVEPRHARIRCEAGTCTLEALESGGSVNLNGEKLDAPAPLGEGDSFTIGKHSLKFSGQHDVQHDTPEVVPLPSAGWLQIQSGAHLGRTIRLDKAFTRIGKPDAQLAVIARRDDGYYLSTLQGDGATLLNDEDIGEASRRLANGDRIDVDTLKAQFFADMQAMQASSAPTDGHADRQRQFSRISFDVNATLSDDTQSWETCLRDVSLHGALIRTPDGFSPAPEQVYRLVVHLEGGPDIGMEVVIAHSEDGEMGLDCKDIDVDSITHLRRLVELNLGDPQLLERELSALG